MIYNLILWLSQKIKFKITTLLRNNPKKSYRTAFSLFFHAFYFNNYRAQAVVAGANCNALVLRVNPVVIVPAFRAVGKGKNILVNCLPCFIAKALRLAVIGIEYLPFFHQRARAKAGNTVFFGLIFLQSGF